VAHYVKNNWVDNVTPVDKSHMDVIENGLIEAADLYYLGDWVAGTYKEGDIVVYNGVAYMAVRQTTQTPVPWAAGQASLSYGTSLPSNPVDGQEAVLVDSVTNPSYTWRFRYNAQSTSPYKWEYIGGAAAVVSVIGGESSAVTGSYIDLASPCRVVLPRAGDYDQIIGATCAHTVAASSVYLAACRNTGAPVWQTNVVVRTANDAMALSPLSFRWTGCAAGDDLRARYYNGAAGTASWYSRWISVTPVRVS